MIPAQTELDMGAAPYPESVYRMMTFATVNLHHLPPIDRWAPFLEGLGEFCTGFPPLHTMHRERMYRMQRAMVLHGHRNAFIVVCTVPFGGPAFDGTAHRVEHLVMAVDGMAYDPLRPSPTPLETLEAMGYEWYAAVTSMGLWSLLEHGRRPV